MAAEKRGGANGKPNKRLERSAARAASNWLSRNLSLASMAELNNGRKGLLNCGITDTEKSRQGDALRRIIAAIAANNNE